MAESIYRKASLAMIPYGAKEDELPSIKPTDGSGDFTFSRGSDIQATRVNASGLIEKAKENLLPYSNTFNTGWSPVAGTLAQGVTDPFGGNTAWSFTATNTDPYLYNQTAYSGVFTLSIWAKGVGSSIGKPIQLLLGGSSTEYTLTSEWQRFEYFANGSGANIGIEVPNPAVAGDVVHIYGAQLNHGLIAQDYVETTTTAVVEGLTADLPRLDYSGGASCPSLLLEPSRTNLVTQSEYFGDSSWTKTAATTQIGFLSPDGDLNAYKIAEDNTNSIHRIYQTSTITASPNATISVYVKYNGRRFVLMRIADSGVGRWYDLIDGVKGGDYISAPNDSTIEPVGNDWYRITISHSVSSVARFELWFSDTESTSAYQGDVTKGVYLYGAQIEVGSYATSYIPTYGTAANRGADSCVASSASALIGATEGTIAGEFTFKSGAPTNRLFSISGADWNTIGHIRFDMISLRPQAKIRSAGADIAEVNGTTDIPIGSLVKFAVVYTSNTFKAFVNGAQVGSTDTLSGSLPAMDEVVIDALGGAFSSDSQNNQLNPYKQALVFKTALTDAECIALTTL